jgi:hypothetical protein
MTDDALTRPAVPGVPAPAAEAPEATAATDATEQPTTAAVSEALASTEATSATPEAMTAADVSAMAEAASTARILEAAGIAVAPDVPPAEDPAAAAEAAAAAAAAAAERGKRRRAMAVGIFRKLAIVVVTVVLFVGGIALGNRAFWNSHPTATSGGQTAVDVPTDSPPPVANEFITALAANNADAVRSSLDQIPHLDLTDEMSKFGIQHIDKVEVLGTKDFGGGRSATEVLMEYQNTDGVPFAINLVILVNGGKIEGFR